MHYEIRIKLTNPERLAFFGPGPAQLLTLVGEGRSLHQAAGIMGMAYSKAWRIIRDAEREMGYPLLDRQRGGVGGGGSALTEAGATLLRRYRLFQAEVERAADQLFFRIFGASDA